MYDKKVISIIEDLIYEDINNEDYWKAVKEAKYLIKKVKAKQLILYVVVGRSEQLKAFYHYVDMNWANGGLTDKVDEVIEGFEKSL